MGTWPSSSFLVRQALSCPAREQVVNLVRSSDLTSLQSSTALAMDFSPYQSSPPEHGRVTSPDYNQSRSPRASLDTAIAGRGTQSQSSGRPFSPSSSHPTNAKSPPPLQHPQPQRGWSGFDGQASSWNGDGGERNVPGSFPTVEVSEFDTSLGLRLDYEACLAYLVVPPLGAIVLLIFERNSDYVRYENDWYTTCFASNN